MYFKIVLSTQNTFFFFKFYDENENALFNGNYKTRLIIIIITTATPVVLCQLTALDIGNYYCREYEVAADAKAP